MAVKLPDGDVVAKRITAPDRDQNEKVIFPYVGPFDVTYRVLLPPAPGGPLAGRAFTLEISRALGTLAPVTRDRRG